MSFAAIAEIDVLVILMYFLINVIIDYNGRWFLHYYDEDIVFL